MSTLFDITIKREVNRHYKRQDAKGVYNLIETLFPNSWTDDGIPVSVEVEAWAELAGPGEEYDNDLLNIKIKD